MFVAVFFELYKLDAVAGACRAVAAEATECVCFWVHLQAGVGVRVERAKQAVVFVGF